jgi:hypothetical protein
MTPEEALEAAHLIRQIQSLRNDVKSLETAKSDCVVIPQVFNQDRSRVGALVTPLELDAVKDFLQTLLAAHIARLKELGVSEPKPYFRPMMTTWGDDE